MIRLWRLAAGFSLVASVSFGQGVSGEVQSVPYELMEQYASKQVDFEDFSEWVSAPVLYPRPLRANGARFGNTYNGQYANGQITGTQASDPLSLRVFAGNLPSISTSSLRPGTYDSITGNQSATFTEGNGSPSLSVLGMNIDGNNLITRSSWDVIRRQAQTWEQSFAIGLAAVTILFDEDQFAVGFRVIRLNRTGQNYSNLGQTGKPRFRVKFFRRDGVLISEVILTPDRDKYVAFARCGQASDIAGIQITNSTSSGLGYDDFIFGVPVGQEAGNREETLNPLEVQLCSIFTS